MTTNKENQFYLDAQTCVDQLMQDSPTMATFLGDHRYDNRLGDFSPGAIQDQRRRIGLWQVRFESYNIEELSLDSQIDRTLMVQLIKNFIRGFDKLHTIHRYPGVGADECLGGVYGLIIREFAPLPERMKNILGRLRETPRVLLETRALLVPHDVPKIWAELAIESAQQGVGLFAGFVPMLAEATPELKVEVNEAAQVAAAALQEQVDWIEKNILPDAQGDFAVGTEVFNEILHEDHMVDYDSVKLLATGWRLFETTQRQMVDLAAQIDPTKTVDQLLEDSKGNHPTQDGLLDAYRQKMAAARQFVVDQQIATIPVNESLRIEPTPLYQRPIIPYAAYLMPGFLEKVQEGVFWVTPVDEGSDPETVEKKLRGHPWADIPVTALHEAYPGHHLQLVVSNSVATLPRKMGAFLSSLFVEGWAFYCEELMEQLGFINQPIQKLARLQAQLWRASRIILDVSLHTSKMPVDEAIKFLVDRAGLEPDDAKAEVRRYTSSPTQPQCYLMGKMQIMDIVAEYNKRNPKTTLREMHDSILNCGSLPPKLMKRKLFGE